MIITVSAPVVSAAVLIHNGASAAAGASLAISLFHSSMENKDSTLTKTHLTVQHVYIIFITHGQLFVRC